MLFEQIRSDMTAAMKLRDRLRVDTLRGAIAACTNELVAKGKKPTDEVTDTDVMAVLKRLAKQRKEAAEQYARGGRPELAEKETSELAIILSYLPRTAARDEIERVARAKKDELGVTDASEVGKLTGAVMKEFAGQADGSLVREVVSSLF